MHIVVHPKFEDVWPFAAHELQERLSDTYPVEYISLEAGETRLLGEILERPGEVRRLISLCVPVTEACLDALSSLETATILTASPYGPSSEILEWLDDRDIVHHWHDREGFWAASVAETALALTLCGLRHIPQKHQSITESHQDWDLESLEASYPGSGGYQYIANPPGHVHGTIADKRVRIVGVGNIGSRYAEITRGLGADVTAYDPYADEPSFHRAGARRVHSLDALVEDAEIFAPMVPLTDQTEGLIGPELIESLPDGALVVLATRAGIVDGPSLKERVLDNELALAADVFDSLTGEPIPLDDPLLGHPYVVHTPHIAGRTRHANREWARMLATRFETGPRT